MNAVNGRRLELVRLPLRAMLRSSLAWGVALALFVLATVAFWPAFKGSSSSLSQAFNQMPSGVVQALGLENLDTPAGFLRGNLYDFLIPLLVIVAAVALASGTTAGEEDAGRLELLLAQPVARSTVWGARVVALAAAVALIAAITFVAQVLSDAAFGLGMPVGPMAATVALCALLGFLHGCVALALAGVAPRSSLALGVAIAIGVAGYLVMALFPLSAPLAPWRHLSPWDWAFGGDPLLHAAAAWRYLSLAVPAVVLAVLGALAFSRRDVSSA